MEDASPMRLTLFTAALQRLHPPFPKSNRKGRTQAPSGDAFRAGLNSGRAVECSQQPTGGALANNAVALPVGCFGSPG